MKTIAGRNFDALSVVRHRHHVTATLLAFLSSFILQPSSFSQTTQPTLAVETGFNNVFRIDAWTPLYVTIAGPSSHPGTIEVRTARGRIGNVVSARVQSNPKPTTFTLYAPLDPLDHLNVQWRDEAGKLVSSIDLTEQLRANPAALGGPVFGIAGPIASAHRVATQLIRDTGEYVAAGAIPTRLLPERAIGYQSLDVLVLPEANLDAIDDAVETQIVRWISAGGIVILWPGDQVPSDGSPLADVLPAKMGDIVTRTIDGAEIAVRSLRPADESVTDLTSAGAPLLVRRIGLGQIALFGFDPTSVYRSKDRRISALREAMRSEVSMSPDDRRSGSFDPLLFQARGEEMLAIDPIPRQTWLWLGLVFGLVMGPGEAVLLLLCRRSIVTPLTMAGCAIALGTVLALTLGTQSIPARSIEVIVEDDSGVVLSTVIHASAMVPDSADAAWMIGRSADPLSDAAGELSLLQRQDRIEPSGKMIALSARPPRIRSIDFDPAAPMLMINGPILNVATQVQSADEARWEKAVVLTPDQLRPLAAAPVPDSATTLSSQLQPATEADDRGTVRIETAIEALANQPGWEPILMDRHLASRIVRLFENESVTALIARRESGNVTQYVIHLQRP